jgi:2,3-bisphosphoglycerate-independent phosphoglycerate mutase
MDNKKPFMLMILDGWGINPSSKGNAVAQANMPYLKGLSQKFPHTQLLCSGEAVGLPEGIMGNSEVGHLNIGAGRVVYQDLLRIDTAIKDHSFFENEALNEACLIAQEKKSSLHLMGLVSDGGVHSQLTHLFALLKLAAEKGLEKVYIHAILDGRDTPPDAGIEYIRKVQKHLDTYNIGRIATICGRFYAMDRDTRWDRTENAFQLYTEGKGIQETDPAEAVLHAYNRGETDEFIKPIIICQEGIIRDRDSIVFFNFRADRARQITRAFTNPEFQEFHRRVSPVLSSYVCMTVYDELFTLPVAFPPQHLKGILGEVISEKGLSQLRIAETEKYAHVTYFFNGGEEKPFPGEDRCLIPSPREVSTYDQKPEMSAHQVGEEVVSRIRTGRYDLIVLNFANMDMVGHTGILNAAVKACEAVDANINKIVSEILSLEGTVLITADHGNAEQMIDDAGNPHTAHTLNPVPLILVNGPKKLTQLRTGVLGDIAPTVLELMEIEKPPEMTCRSLIENE